jgi:hypothetical protein
MITHQERAKLVESFRDEPLYARALTAKCAACLLILAGIAVIGVDGGSRTSETASGDTSTQEIHDRRLATSDAATPRAPEASMHSAQSRSMFQLRRAEIRSAPD